MCALAHGVPDYRSLGRRPRNGRSDRRHAAPVDALGRRISERACEAEFVSDEAVFETV